MDGGILEMKRSLILPLLLVVAMLFGCTAGPSAEGAARLASPAQRAVRGMKKDGSSIGTRAQVAEEYLAALRSFCVRAAREGLPKGAEENALISPVSLYLATAVLAGAAEGETKEELLQALGVEAALAESETAKLLANMHIDDAMGKLHAAGSIWIADAFADALDLDAIQNLADGYGVEAWRADFALASAQDQISAWIAEQTEGLLGRGEGFSVDPKTALLLFNTVYYRDEWSNRFDRNKTAPATFYNADGSQTQCEFLNATYGIHGFSRYENDAVGCTLSTLQLKHGAMTFILPDADCTPQQILADADAFDAIVSGRCESGVGEVVWKIPKFDYAAEAELSQTLQAMGISAAFDPALANFAGLLEEKAGMPLWVNGVRQQARISINEDGVEAAAYTQIDVVGSPMPEGRADMILDRPFLYYISAEGALLFVGIVNRM